MNIQDFDAFCFDLDGTILLGNERLPGAKKIVDQIRGYDKKVLFITNSPTQTRDACARRLNALGIKTKAAEVLTTPFVSALYFLEHYPDARVYIVGEEAIHEEFHQLSLTITENPLEATHVLVGLDRSFTYEKLNLAVMAVRNGANIIVTNPDPSCPVPGGVMADTLSIAKAIEVASGQEITDVVGKPSLFFGERMLGQLNIERERCLIIGDRLETDILLGKINQFPTCLVLTGIARKEDIETRKIYPDFIVGDLTAFWKL
ncbi:HAD-IIA family hydrolase [Bacillus sp. OxB-1]|uniref:HAD-IIA family hydrolase n=1 Tax=Bacillus sp. (strain OxB-1) TaxID=98228 RepID=UPI001E49EBE5|nr:HAD-IIA family hydrolase [Bacillus sp. OxB-1]